MSNEHLRANKGGSGIYRHFPATFLAKPGGGLSCVASSSRACSLKERRGCSVRIIHRRCFFLSLLLVAETTPHRYIVSVFFATSIAVDRTLAHFEHWRGFARRSISTYLAIQSIYLYLGSMLTLTLALPKDVPDERF